MRSVVRLVFTGVAGLLLLLAFSPGANAQDPYKHSVGLKPSSGDPGSPFTISWNFYPCASGTLSFTWDGAGLASGNASLDIQTGTVNTAVPGSAKPGPHTVTGSCTNARTKTPLTGSALFTVTGVVITTPPPVVTTPPPVTQPPVTKPTRPGTTTPTTTTPATTTPTTPPSTTDTPSTTSTAPGDGELVLDRPSIQPGDALSASGKGCEPGHTVTLTSDGDTVGHAVADTTGAFVSPVEFTRIEAGKHTVVADCGVRLTGAVEQVVTSSSGGHTGTLVVLVFFILAGITAVRFR